MMDGFASTASRIPSRAISEFFGILENFDDHVFSFYGFGMRPPVHDGREDMNEDP